MNARARWSRAVLLALSSAVGASCINFTTQRWPKPMSGPVRNLPPGDQASHPVGPEEATVLRHADPVSYRPANTLSGIPMAFYDKTKRLNAGGSVVVAPGGLAEVVWPDGSSVSMSGYGIGWITSPSRGEPLFELQEVTRARIQLGKPGAVRLVGGALLRGVSGPYHVERLVQNTLLVHNQSKGALFVEYREAVFELGPGQAVELPLLSQGGAPIDRDGAYRSVAQSVALELRGDLQAFEEENGTTVVRQEHSRVGPGLEGLTAERSIRTQGVTVHIEDGEWVRLNPRLSQPRQRARDASNLEPVATDAPSDAELEPAPAPAPAPGNPAGNPAGSPPSPPSPPPAGSNVPGAVKRAC